MEPRLPKLIAIVGPTASGKTSLAISIAEHLDGEIVSADSRQIYRGMDIGTAKPSETERRAVPHHLIDIKNPDQEYTVADYKRAADRAIADIIARGKLPIIAGGTGLYIRAVLENLSIPAIKADPKLRKEIEAAIVKKGLPAVFKELVTLDPEAEYVVDPKNPRRVVRALEVARTTGEPFTAQRTRGKTQYDALMIGISFPPATLRARLNDRVDEMIGNGLVAEVESLATRYGDDCAAFDAIGYREIINYLRERATLDDTILAIKMNTWQYAKRQLTWFRKDKTIRWLQNPDAAIPLATAFVKNQMAGTGKIIN